MKTNALEIIRASSESTLLISDLKSANQVNNTWIVCAETGGMCKALSIARSGFD